ncbi:MAG: TlpA family protein disulfide reductase [Flavobacteriales bacterium]|nr:TlpA family protein disulfide reductase [Flavobacteriales bacterium]
MNFIKSRIEKWKSKSTWGKVSDLLFIAIMVLLIFPDGRMLYRKALLQTGLFNMGTSFYDENIDFTKEASAVVILDRAGNTMDLSHFSGKVTFVNFWATWCPPCRAELSSIIDLYEQYKGNPGTQFLLITHEDFSTTDAFLAKQNLPADLPVFKLMVDYQGSIFSGSLPTTAVIDKEGKVAYLESGMANYTDKAFVEGFNKLLN